VKRDSLAHADQAVAAAYDRCLRTGTVVDDFELERVPPVADVDTCPRLAGMLERVRQRLLDDPVRGELDPDRKLAAFSLDAELDGKAGLANLRDERRDVAEPRLRRERLVGVAAQHSNEAAHLGERAAADL